MKTQRYTIRRVSVLSLARFGGLLGGVAICFPGLLCALVSQQLLAAARVLLADWGAAEVELPGVEVPLDFVTLLGLTEVQALVVRLDEYSLVLALLIVLGSVIGGGLLVAMTMLPVGWVYNAVASVAGGLQVELREE
jgi:hypothetical protein